MSTCIYCGVELPEGYGWVCKECYERLQNKKFLEEQDNETLD